MALPQQSQILCQQRRVGPPTRDVGLLVGMALCACVTGTARMDGTPTEPVVPPVIVPAVPTGLVVQAGDGEVSLSWQTNPAVDQVIRYQVYRDDALVADGPTATSYIDVGLTNGTVFAYRVSALNVVGYGPWTEPALLATPSAGPTQTLLPAAIPLSDPELPNAMRGQYAWLGNPPQPPGWPVLDSYVRPNWKELEPTQDNYDFSLIDNELAAAAARGGRLGFRFMAACTDGCPPGASVPDYLLGTGQWVDVGGSSYFVPAWNDDFYLSRIEALLAALGSRYDADPRFGWVDMNGYGNWGEWHEWPWNTGYSLTDLNAARIINANINNFPSKRFVMLTGHQGALSYAMGLSSRIGIRVDCLGTVGLTGAEQNLNRVPESLDRWQTAPFITEWCSNDYAMGAQQVAQFHISMLSSGNTGGAVTSQPQNQQDAFAVANKEAGYRFVIDSVTLPMPIERGVVFTATTAWQNINVAPAYQPRQVMLQLRAAAGGPVSWQSQSAVDLEALLPTSGTPQMVADALTVPVTLASGTYVLTVQIIDPEGNYLPLRLGIAGRQADGSYELGNVVVQ